MTIAEWLAERTPRPPEALRSRLAVLLADDLQRDVAEAPELMLAAGEGLVRAILQGGSTSRDTALDLLTADALVTYAFEAASESPGDLAQRAARAMSRIASLGLDAAAAR